MVIYTTEISVLVDDVERFSDELGRLALTNGGYVAGVETRNDNGVPTVVVRLKVPPERYQVSMSGIRGLAVEVRSEKATTQDVSEEFSDTQTQIASLEATHAQLLELMKRTGSVEELLKVQQQAGEVKLQIDRLKGRATALERLSALATVTVTAQLANLVLERDYTAALASVRQAEAQRVGLLAQLKHSRSPEEESSVRDKLGQVELALQRERTRVTTIEQLATRLAIALPRPDEATTVVASDDTLPADYLQTRVDLKRAQAEQQRITAELETGAQTSSPARLQDAILRTNSLAMKLKVIQDRAGQVGITLPTVSAQEEAAMARTGAPSLDGLVLLHRAWDTSLAWLVQLGALVVMLWWVLLPLAVGSVLLIRRSRTQAASS
jgi:hypothetical protein